MKQGESADQALLLAADRLWSMVDEQLDSAVCIVAGEGVDWNKWQEKGLSFFELVVEEKASEMFAESGGYTHKEAISLREKWAAELSAKKMTKKAVNRAVELISMLGTLYLIRESMKSDGADQYFDLAADAYRATGALMEVLHDARNRASSGKKTGAVGGRTAAVNRKSTALSSWAVLQYEEYGNKQSAQSFVRGLNVPDHLKDAVVVDPERVMADAIRKHLRARRQTQL